MSAGRGGAPVQAPRWGPERPLAERITRRGVFAAIDPARARPLPRCGKWAGFAFWAVLTGGSLYRAWRASHVE
ncbi:MAG: hypothetical protein KY462_02635 [Actinobacteria bacterium]|nr:hypothetical protein [Actinomycetota bacterium]